MTSDPSAHAGLLTQLARDAASAAATVLPSADPLTVGELQPAGDQVTSRFAAAVSVELGGVAAGTLTLLVGEVLVDMLGASPMGPLDVAAAVQPALDAAAAALGCSARAGAEVSLDSVALLGAGSVVPLVGGGVAVAALLLPETTLEAVLLAESGGYAGPAAPTGLDDLRRGAVDPVATIATAPPAGSAVTPPAGASLHAVDGRRGIEMLHGVEMEVTVELGRTRMSVRELLALAPGTVLALDRAAGAPADLLVNGRLVARGEVVVVDEDFGLRVTEILDHAAAV